MSKTADYQEYWNGKSDGGHRYGTEAFLEKEAEEKSPLLYSTRSGGSLLDVGCGSAELTTYYARRASSVVACDFSPTMLSEAQKRIEFQGLTNIELHQASAVSVGRIFEGRTFEVVTAGQVIQYLNPEELSTFLDQAIEMLSVNGRIVLFDIIDPFLVSVFATGMTRLQRSGVFRKVKSLLKVVRTLSSVSTNGEGFVPSLGYTYSQPWFDAFFRERNFSVDIRNSTYYEYRYHVIAMKSNTSTRDPQ